MSSQIDDYIRENRERYTREAIREQLIAAGHDPVAVDAGLDRAAVHSAVPARPVGWRPRTREFVILVVLGAIGTVILYANYPYGGAAIAPVVYVILASIAFGFGKWMSILVDSGSIVWPVILLGLVAAAVAISGVLKQAPLALVVALLPGVPALLLLYLPRSNAARTLAAALPILFWLVVTGTCYSPWLQRT